MDPLSDVLALLKPRSYLSAGFDAAGKWSIHFPQTKASNAMPWFLDSAGCPWTEFSRRCA
jgi:hypothetical protein